MTTNSTSASLRLLRSLGLTTALTLGASLAIAQTTPAPPYDDGPDPALVNMAPADQTPPDQTRQDQTAPAPGSNPQDYLQQTPAPIVRSAPKHATTDIDNAPATDDQTVGQPANPQADAQVAAGEAALDDSDSTDGATFADQAPPPLPDYDQPPAPADDYLWTPGYWAYGPVGYYWVPGVWIVPPYYGALWTPPWWGWWNGRYRWHAGYWGPHVGFYGGINYGFGYIGTGYFGGYWNHGHFFYNRSVTNVGASVTNVYSRTVVYNNMRFGPRPVNNISYNGGRGGISVAPRPAEIAAIHESHIAPLPGQVRLHEAAAQNPQAAFAANRGRPAVAVQTNPLGANRTIAPSQASFQTRGNANIQAQRPAAAPRVEVQRPAQQQPRPQQPSQPRSAPQPQYHPAPAPRAAAPAPSHETKH